LVALPGVIVASILMVSAAQNRAFEDKANGFSITMAGDWKAITYSDAVGRQKTEFIYRDRSEGLLRVSRNSLEGKSVADAVRSDQEGLKAYRQGFELSSSEPFGADGIRVSFYYNESGKRFAETDYFLKEGDHVWELRFTGKRGVLDLIRNLTDQMAHSFKPM
ncbi:MAG: hypothetical protein ACREDR_41800, partial [Blastocatellia bacterium]